MVPASMTDAKGFLDWCRANPQDANYGSPGAGSKPHFIGALLGLIAQGSARAERGTSQKQPYDRRGPLIKRIGFTAES